MIHEYLYEIIGLIIVLTAIVIYFVIKRANQEEEENFAHTKHHEDKKQDTIPDIPDTVETNKVKDIDDTEPLSLNCEEEGSFGNIDQNPFEEPKKVKKRHRIKGVVPKHGKIVKDNFKEFAGSRILIAEDNLINQKVLNGLLSDTGIDVIMADDGQIALDILEKDNNFNIILMDAHMPRIDGFEATRIIRANPNYEHIVVVALSGDTASDDIRKMSEAGMQEQLAKPLRMDELYDVLYAYIKADVSNIKSKFVEVIMTKELNGDKGLEVCGGDEDFYHDILNQFTQNYADSPQKLVSFIKNGNNNSADAMLLDIIGITANIGADNLNSITQDMKQTLKDLDQVTFTQLINKYNKHLKILLKDIKDYKNL